MSKKTYRYELHCHTREGSRCSKIFAQDLVDFYISQGYDGIVISDHFTENNTIPKETPWRERIETFYENGFDKARRYGEEKGLKVFFGPEWSWNRTDFLIYGLDKDWWMEQDGFFSLSVPQALDRVHEGGGFVIHAHPFAEAKFIECIRLFPRHVDAVEVINGARALEINQRAVQYAESYGLLMTGGTDAHSDKQTNMCGIEVPYECHTIADIIHAIRNGDAKPISETQMELLNKHE